MPTFFHDRFLLYLFAVSLISLVTLLVKVMITKGNLKQEFGRKILHFFAISSCALVIYYTEHHTELAVLFVLFTIILCVVAHQNILLPSDRKSYGIALFPLSFAILLLTSLPKDALVFGVMTLGISDAVAGWIGQVYGKNQSKFLYESKSWIGFWAFYGATCGIAYVMLGLQWYILLLALVPALSELFSYRGSDNLTIPLVSALWYAQLIESPPNTKAYGLLLIMLLLCLVVYRKKWLTEQGTAAALLVGTVILFTVGASYLLPMAIFFVAGSLASKLHPKNKDASGRTAIQVFSNGGIAAICALLYSFSNNESYLLAFLISVSISLADTISSDLGTYFRQSTYDIRTLKRTTVGLSGGISFAGTLAGAGAAILFAVFCTWWLKLSIADLSWIAIGGILGMFVDSLLGSWLQGKYRFQEEVVDSYAAGATLVRGRGWFDNNMANLWSNILVILGFLLLR